MLKMNNITKTFNSGTVDERVALDHLSLTLRDGDFVTVIGGNGAGKSTMQNAICGTWQPDEGSIELDGVNVSSLPEYKRARYLGRVYQDPMMGTSAGMEIEENLALAERRGRRHTLRPGIRRGEREDYRRRLRELGLGLEDRLTTKVGTLSGGQRQALTLLMATLQKPKLLLDEHTAALDPQTAQRVMDITDRLVRENHLTTLMITHNMRDAIHYGNRLLMLHNGRIVLDISGEEKVPADGAGPAGTVQQGQRPGIRQRPRPAGVNAKPGTAREDSPRLSALDGLCGGWYDGGQKRRGRSGAGEDAMKKIDNCENSTVLVALLLAGILLVMGAYRLFSWLCSRGLTDTLTWVLGAAALVLAALGLLLASRSFRRLKELHL